MKGRDYEYLRVSPGNYRVVINVFGKEYATNATILEDIWFDN